MRKKKLVEIAKLTVNVCFMRIRRVPTAECYILSAASVGVKECDFKNKK